MKVNSVIYRHFAEIILELNRAELESLKHLLILNHKLSTIMIQLYTKEELNKILFTAIQNRTEPILFIEGIPIQVDMQFVSSLILKLEEKENEPERRR